MGVVAYTHGAMHTVTATLDEQTYRRLRTLAEARGLAPGDLLAGLVHDWLAREAARTEGLRVLAELAGREDRLPHDEAVALAVAEQRAMAAERRAPSRP